MNDFLSLREAAELAGTSKTRLWRSIQEGLLPAQISDRGKQKVYQVSREALASWAKDQGAPVTFQNVTGGSGSPGERFGVTFGNVASFAGGVGHEERQPVTPPASRFAPSDKFVPLEAFESTKSALQQALHDALEVAREQREDRIEAERRATDAEERAMRIARQTQALAEELGAQKRLLAENAESLVEKRAEIMEAAARAEQAQAQAEEIVAREEQARLALEELYRLNAEEKARYERDREDLLEKLAQSEAKASRLEKMPRWITKLFAT